MARPKVVCESTYDSQQMLSLATEIPDLMSDFFHVMLEQRTASDDDGVTSVPWDMDPCTFQIHPRTRNEGCPRALGGRSCFEYPDLEARIHYLLQFGYVIGMKSSNVSAISMGLGEKKESVIVGIDRLVASGANVEWMEAGQYVGLLTPAKLRERMGGEEE